MTGSTIANQKPILISAGEPAGIGPDIVLDFAQQPLAKQIPWLAIGDYDLFASRAKVLNMKIKIVESSPATAGEQLQNTSEPIVPLLPFPLTIPAVAGSLNVDNAIYVVDMLTEATHYCLSQECHALVTAPVHKGIINQANIAFTGHTEFLAKLSETKQVVMMLAAGKFRVALATTHLPLRQVADSINPSKLAKTIDILHQDLISKFGIERPVIRVCGLNPHAGEQGHLGREELEIINPVIEQYQSSGYAIHGSYPADTLFTPKYLATSDAFLAMYHDQGLPVLKHVGFGNAVNITLGLPFIRTSVDHGTALDLAGSGKAESNSLIAAIYSANLLGRRRRANH